MRSLRNRFRNKFGMTLLFILFSIFFLSCENAVDSAYDKYIEESESTAEGPSKKAYIVFNLVEAGRTAGNNANRTVTSGVTSSLFSDITFSGTKSGGGSLEPITASSFAQLSGRSIEVEAGSWTFDLEAWLGKTASNPGEKYVASQTLNVEPGSNELKMTLTADSAAAAAPESHPGSWEVRIKFPCTSTALIDQVTVNLIKYSDYSNPIATPLYTKTFERGSDFAANGQQTLTVSETSRASGNYIVNVSFLRNTIKQGTAITSEKINAWSEFMRINPGAQAKGTIELQGIDKSYSITYVLNGAQWDTTSSDSIPVSYTRSSGASGVITLPAVTAFVDRGSLYTFEGWYTDEDFAAGSGPVTDFNVTDAANKTFYAKWHEPVFDVYIRADGNDSDDGSKNHPLKNATAAYAKFADPAATNSDGSIRNTIHILSDYTGTDTIATPWGDASHNGLMVKFVGEKGGVENAPVTLNLDMSNCGTPLGPQSFIYIENSQKLHFRYINITSKDIYEHPYQHPNGFGCLFATRGTEIIFEDSSIKGYVANGCSALAIKPDGNASLPEGIIRLKNCEISGNSSIDADTNPDSVWGCAINASSGILHLEGKVIIKNNVILKNDGTQESEAYNLYVGNYNSSGNLDFNSIVIDGPLTGSEIWFKLAQEPRVFTSGYTSSGTETHNTAIPSTYFHSDSGMEVVLNPISNEAELSKSFVVYVSSSSSSPAGSNTSGDGTSSKPFASIEKAVQKISSFNDSELEATICVTGNIPCNAIIDDDGSTGTKLVAKSLTIQGTGTSSGGNWKTAAGQAILNGDTDDDNAGNGTILLVSAHKPLTLRNLTLKNGKSTSSGGALCYDGTKTVFIDSCLIQDNEAVDYGGALFFSGSNVSLSYTEITNNKVTGTGSDYGQGGALYLNGGNMTYGASVSFKSNFAARYGGAISVVNNGQVTMTGGIIEGNGALTQGGGVYIGNTASFIMSGFASVIKNNGVIGYRPISGVTSQNKTAGGGVYVAEGGIFTMNGGEISGNLGRTGAGLCVIGTATLNDGTITTNKKTTHDGTNPDLTTNTISQLASILTSRLNNYTGIANVEVGIPGTFNMYNGTITQAAGITTNGQNGAGVNIFGDSAEGDSSGTATFNMYDGSITGLDIGANSAVSLRMLFSGGHAVFNMYGGSITNNKYKFANSSSACNGGAIYIGKNSEFTMTGGEISGNHAKANGGAVYVDAVSSANIYLGTSGSESTITIKDNTAGDSTQLNNIFLPSGEEILINGPLSSSSQVGVTRYGGFSSTPFTIGFDSSNGTEPADVFTSDAGYSIITDASGEAAFGSSSGGLYMPADYTFSFTADRNTVTVGHSAQVTITPTVTRKESDGSEIELYYNPADQKLYLNPTFTQVTGGGNAVSWQASLWCGTDVEQASLAAGTSSNANKFTIAALSYPDTYSLHVQATYMGYTHDASFTVEGVAGSTEVTLATPLTLEAAANGAVVTFTNKASGPVTYKVNGGTAQTIASGTSSNITLTDIGDKVEFFGNNTVYGYSSSDSSSISCSENCYVYGNIMSLINSTGYETADTLTGNYAFAHLFHNNTKLKNKSGAALLLPATTLSKACYRDLFSGCTSLTIAPALPATTLAYECYMSMFYGCTSITTAPVLSATTLSESCYGHMFENCTGLINAPDLPATDMEKNCYNSMFTGCTSLAHAPDLPAETLEFGCYSFMFMDCTSLNSITCLAIDISAAGCVTQWLRNVASTGTFTKASSMTGWTSGEDGIPSGWTIQNAP